MNRDKALEQWKSVKSVKGSDLPMLLLDMKQGKELDKKKKASKKETEKAKKALVAEIQKDIALEKKKADLTTKRAKLTLVVNNATEKELKEEEIQQDKDLDEFTSDQSAKKKTQAKAAANDAKIAAINSANDKAFIAENAKVTKQQHDTVTKKKTIPKLWAVVMRKYYSFVEDLREALVNPETIDIEDVVQFKATLKGLYTDVQKYKSLAGVDSNAFIKKLDWHRKRLVDLENLVVRQVAIDTQAHVLEKKQIAQAQDELAEAKDLLELYKRTGDVRKIAQAQEAVNEAEKGVSKLTQGRFGKLVDQTRGEDEVVSIRKGVALALSWVGHKTVGAAGRGLGKVGKGAFTAIANTFEKGLAKVENPILVKAIGGLTKATKSVATGVKAVGTEAYKWIGKKMGQLSGMITGFLRSPLQSVGGLGNIFGLAALGTMIIAPLVKGMNERLEKEYGEHYIKDFVDGLWDKGWKFLVRKVKEFLGISTREEDAKASQDEATKKAALAKEAVAKAQEAYNKNPTPENAKALADAKGSVTKADDTVATTGVEVFKSQNTKFGLAGENDEEKRKNLYGYLVNYRDNPNPAYKVGDKTVIDNILADSKYGQIPEATLKFAESLGIKIPAKLLEPPKPLAGGRGATRPASNVQATPSRGSTRTDAVSSATSGSALSSQPAVAAAPVPAAPVPAAPVPAAPAGKAATAVAAPVAKSTSTASTPVTATPKAPTPVTNTAMTAPAPSSGSGGGFAAAQVPNDMVSQAQFGMNIGIFGGP